VCVMRLEEGKPMFCRVALHEKTPGSVASDDARGFRNWVKEQPLANLRRVQRRREWPVRLMQAMQAAQMATYGRAYRPGADPQRSWSFSARSRPSNTSSDASLDWDSAANM
jgi:hypothetical protein